MIVPYRLVIILKLNVPICNRVPMRLLIHAVIELKGVTKIQMARFFCIVMWI